MADIALITAENFDKFEMTHRSPSMRATMFRQQYPQDVLLQA